MDAGDTPPIPGSRLKSQPIIEVPSDDDAFPYTPSILTAYIPTSGNTPLTTKQDLKELELSLTIRFGSMLAAVVALLAALTVLVK